MICGEVLGARTEEYRYERTGRIYRVESRELESGQQEISNGVHVNRGIDCNCHHCAVGVDIGAGTGRSKETDEGSYMSAQPASMGPYLGDVH